MHLHAPADAVAHKKDIVYQSEQRKLKRFAAGQAPKMKRTRWLIVLHIGE